MINTKKERLEIPIYSNEYEIDFKSIREYFEKDLKNLELDFEVKNNAIKRKGGK